MARTEEKWAKLAKAVEEAGVDAIELNFSCPNMVEDYLEKIFLFLSNNLRYF